MKACVKVIAGWLLVCCFQLFGQIDTEFWFAAPEITVIHADRPIYLYVSSFDQSGTVTIYQPANPIFAPIVRTFTANSTVKIDLTPYIEDIENLPADQILNKGLLISATVPVTAYYEVFGSSGWAPGVNSDLFALKGNHALGTTFYIPFQTHWDNNPTQDAWASFDIVATEDNTLVTINPTQDVVGHAAGTPYSITLNRGQTYSARASSNLASLRPAGSLVTSTKPIAITTKDDSMFEMPNYDTAGDQLIPVSILGKKYIATQISDIGMDRVYVLATANNTELFLDGNAAPVATLQAGEQYEIHLTNVTALIESSEPVYVFHVSGFQNELGGALLPPLNCTGSKQVSVNRSTNEEFNLLLICESGAEGSFTVNNNAAVVTGPAFQDVAGSAGAYKFLKLELDYTFYPADQPILIKNSTGNFHVGIVNGASSTGFRYGYFSDYGFLELGADKFICEGDSIRIQSTSFLDSYTWYKTNAPTPISTESFVMLKDSGIYYVEATKGACEFTDTIGLQYFPAVVPPILSMDDTATCANDPIYISAAQDFTSYLWSTGERRDSIQPEASGMYWLQVKNVYGCKKSDTVLVTLYPIPEPGIVYQENKKVYCKDSLVLLSSEGVHESYLWSNGDTDAETEVQHNMVSGNDFYWLEVRNEFDCVNRDTLRVDCSTEIGMIPNLLLANKDGRNDVFYIEDLKSGRWNLSVFNRWGNLVFEDEKYHNDWQADGMEEGVYFFQLRHPDYDLEHKGWLHILRND